MAEAIVFAHGVIREVCAMQRELAEKVGVQKMAFSAAAGDGLYDAAEGQVLRRLPGRQADGRQAGPGRGGGGR